MKYLLVNRYNSIRFKLIIGISCILVPVISFLIFDNFYAISVIRNQVARSNMNMLSQYMNQIDNSLNLVDSYLYSMAFSDIDVQILDSQSDENELLVSTANLSSKLSKDVIAYNNMDCLFVYDTLHHKFIYGQNDSASDAMKSYVIDNIDKNEANDVLFSKYWKTEKVGNDYYLVKMVKLDGLYIGAWVRVKNLLLPLNFIDMGKGGASMFLTTNGDLMATSDPIDTKKMDLKGEKSFYITGTSQKYLMVKAKSDEGNFELAALIEDKKILEKLPLLQQMITFIAFLSIFMLPLSIFFLHKTVITPLNKILDVMNRVTNGDIELRIQHFKSSNEFLILNNTFNNMLDQMHDLRINIYEEQLKKQKAELKQLQLQVNPHFFLNSLNIIYRLAQTQKYDLIQEMSLCLLQYFRYVFKNDITFVRLCDELQHTRNYMRIQELRFPGYLTFQVKADEFLMNVPIPPLIIQSFIENSIKYAFTLDEPLHIYVDVTYEKIDDAEKVKIVIRDTGKGFSNEILEKIKDENPIADERGEHMGIWIVKKRLRLLYADLASIRFENGDPSGAIVEMILPYNPNQMEDTKDESGVKKQ